MFLCESIEILNVFNASTLKEIFWKIKNILKKLEYHFLIQSTTNESATFPYKNALSKANVKTNWMGSLEGTYNKKHTFATDYFTFLKI